MDLKALLLNSISSKRPLLFNRRMHIGKSCYTVTFEVNGKLLTVMRIRQIYTKAPFQKRIQRRRKFLQKLKSTTSFETNESLKSITTTSTAIPPPTSPPLPTTLPELADCATQTSKPQMRSRTTETESQVFSIHRQQQTIRRFQRKQGTQTEPSTSSQAIQTEQRIATRGTQTCCNVPETISTQTENYCCNNQVQTEPQQEDLVNAEREKEAVVFMLNEIGEMIINQNHLLQNNSTMLSQISEMTMLSKVEARQKDCKQMEKQHQMQRLSRKRARLRCIPTPASQQPVDRRNQWVQTTYPIGLSSKTTQTRQEARRHKRFRFFCFST